MVQGVRVEVLQDIFSAPGVFNGLVVGELGGCEGVIPVQLIADDVLSTVVRLLPPQLDAGAAHIPGHQAARLAGDALLGLDLDRSRQWPRPYAGVCLHSDGVDGVRGEVTDGGQLVVVHKL